MKKYAVCMLISLTTLGITFGAYEDQWKGFDYEHLGITTTEFDLVKEHKMSKDELLQIIEYGIMPSEYFSEPWEKLGVSKREWLSQKKQGMENADMDRSIYQKTNINWDPVISFVLPGFYAYKTNRPKIGGTMSGVFAAGLLLTFFHQEKTSTGTITHETNVRWFYPVICLAAMTWSSGDAYLGTRFRTNTDAQRFSINIVPGNMPSAVISMRF